MTGSEKLISFIREVSGGNMAIKKAVFLNRIIRCGDLNLEEGDYLKNASMETLEDGDEVLILFLSDVECILLCKVVE